jgi:hypothetical protein
MHIHQWFWQRISDIPVTIGGILMSSEISGSRLSLRFCVSVCLSNTFSSHVSCCGPQLSPYHFNSLLLPLLSYPGLSLSSEAVNHDIVVISVVFSSRKKLFVSVLAYYVLFLCFSLRCFFFLILFRLFRFISFSVYSFIHLFQQAWIHYCLGSLLSTRT